MLDFSKPVFPSNFISSFADRIKSIDSRVHVKTRRLKMTDPSISLGLFGESWAPDSKSHEIMGSGFPGLHEPSINIYTVIAQGLVIDTEEERGLGNHYALANFVRTTLGYNEQLGVSLSQATSVITDKHHESLRRWFTRDQKYYTADMGSSKWAYMSVMKINLETEIRRVA